MMKHQTKGFTLIEILVVVVIVATLSVIGVQLISSGSVERNLKQHGRILQASIQYNCDQASLQNLSYGIKFSINGYNFAHYVNQQWLDVVSQDVNFTKVFEDGSLLNLEVDGQEIVLNEDFDEIPQVMCDSTGELTPFKVSLSDASNKHHYRLKTVGFWDIEGEWLANE
jgi:general secretion pathway protein H